MNLYKVSIRAKCRI